MGSFWRNSENHKEQSFENKRFRVSDKSFKFATIVSSLIITIVVIILFIIEKTFAVSEIDIQTISGITAGLCGFALAIPLFLRDFDITSNFWKQFYLIAITFLVTTFIGVIAFLLIDDTKSIDVTLYLFFFLSIIISVNINNFNLLWKISLNPVLNLLIAYIFLFISLFFSEGNFWVYSTVLFTIYGFYLILTLMLSILVELFVTNRNTEDNDTRIKKAIQKLAETHKDKALDEQTLLDKLKTEIFFYEPEIISRVKVKDLVIEMNSETADNKPKITTDDYYDKVIPRWKNEYDILLEENPVCIILSVEYYSTGLMRHTEKESDSSKEKERIFEIISEKTGLSIELLKENNIVNTKFVSLKGEINYIIDCDNVRANSESSVEFKYLINRNVDIRSIGNFSFLKNYIEKASILISRRGDEKTFEPFSNFITINQAYVEIIN